MMRYTEILFENDSDILSQQALGTIISYTRNSGFSQNTIYFMKMSDGEWKEVFQDGYEKGNLKFINKIGETADINELNKLFVEGKVSRPVEGISIGDRIKNSIQVHALPDGTIIENPNSSVDAKYKKENGEFISQDGKIIPEWAFDTNNAVWKE